MKLTKSPAVNIANSEYLATGQPLFIGGGVFMWLERELKNEILALGFKEVEPTGYSSQAGKEAESPNFEKEFKSIPGFIKVRIEGTYGEEINVVVDGTCAYYGIITSIDHLKQLLKALNRKAI